MVHLVDERKNGDSTLSANGEEFLRLRFNALSVVDEHHRAVGGGEGSVGVRAEVVVARGVEQVQNAVAEFELEDRRGDGNSPLFLKLHPVGSSLSLVATGLHRSGELDGASVEKELLGEGRLSRVGVGDDGESSPSGGLLGNEAHKEWASSSPKLNGTAYYFIYADQDLLACRTLCGTSTEKPHHFHGIEWFGNDRGGPRRPVIAVFVRSLFHEDDP